MRAVNLLPSDGPKRSQQGGSKLPVVLAATAPVVAVAAVFAFYSIEHSSVTSKSSQLQAVQHQIAKHPVQVPRAPAISGSLISLRGQRAAAVEDALTSEVAWDRVLGDVARVIPDGVYLTDLSATAPVAADVPRAAGTPPPAPTPEDFTISGFTSSHDSVAHLVSRLELVPSLRDVTLSSFIDQNPTGKPQINFQVTATVVGSGFGAAS